MLNAIRIMMKEIIKNAPREDKNGWRLQKFHDLIHVVRDIENFGSPNNVDAAPNENNLIDFAKRPGRRAYKKREVFVSQVSKRLRETDLIRKPYKALMRTLDTNNSVSEEAEDNVMDIMDTDNEHNIIEDNEIQSKLIGQPLFHVNLGKPLNQGMVECLAERSVRTRRELHPIIISFLCQEQDFDDFPLYGERIINIYTEYKRDGTCYLLIPIIIPLESGMIGLW